MNQRDKVISIARTELGYAEESSGWTKYGQWYADNVAHNQSFATADWCNMFVTWVMRQANVTADVYPDTSPQGSACPYCLGWMQSHGCRTGADDMPQPGDLVFYSWSPGEIDHIGIIESVTGDSADNAVMTVIEGNYQNSVARRVIAYRNADVVATCRPKYDLTDIPITTDVSAPFELSNGAEGSGVELLQMALAMHGYDVGSAGIDGDLGQDTDKALRQFQADHGLTVDGIAGTDTWRALCGA